MKFMSQRRYRKEGSGRCPFCGGENLSGGFIEVEKDKAYQPVSCSDCGKTWSDVYQLQGYVELS